ncbi:phosphofructokinase [Holotrichia oblita]|nr:phosphofructokinase [Holotrichia oblita]
MKKIAILTSGGDAPGMNAAIRAAVRYAIYVDMEVIGIARGYQGLLDEQMYNMDMRSVADIIQRGGTILRTARCPEFVTKEGQKKGVEILRKNDIDGVIVIGGDGSFMGAKALSELGIPTIGIPGTIDNDLAYTDYSIGFDTACNTILDAINKIRDTMTSHERFSIIEVMGRHCGDLALYTGVGGGAEIIIVPEHKLDIEKVCEKMRDSKKRGKMSGIILLAEGAGHAHSLAEEIKKHGEFSIRSSVLGHLQRGGSPSMKDRYLGTNMGVYAVKLLEQGIGNRIVGIRDNKFYDMDIVEGCAMKKEFNIDLYNLAGIVARNNMITIGNFEVFNLNNAIRGARNPLCSWDRSDSFFDEEGYFVLGENDLGLAQKLTRAGSDHRKFMRQVFVSVDINAPLYWWKEFDTYKVGTVANSTSTMHTLHKHKIVTEMFSTDKMDEATLSIFSKVLEQLEGLRNKYLETKDKSYWYSLIQLLPSSFNQLRTCTLTYENLINIYWARKGHKLDEWHYFCGWIEELPYFKEIAIDKEKAE